jgi:collagen type VII alpha
MRNMMKKLLLCIIGLLFPVLSYGQMTQITGTGLRIGSNLISKGTVCAVAVDINQTPVAVAIDGGGMQGIGQSCGNIVAGAITGAVGGGTYTVADEALSLNPGFYYTFTIRDTSNGTTTSGDSYQLNKVPDVTGTTWELDHYAPVTTTYTYPAFTFNVGVGAPGNLACSGKSFYQDNTVPTAPVLYSCGPNNIYDVVTTSNGGGTGTAATIAVGTTSTGAAGSQASVTNSGTASAAVFNFTIPVGATGATGPQGDTGPQGEQGIAGATGPQGQTGATGAQGIAGATGAAATIAVGTVTTGSAGSSVTVTNSGSSGAAVLNFIIPQGQTGTTGAAGSTGAAGTAATITVGTVSSLAVGSTPTVTNVGTSNAAEFNFGIPVGATGATGPTGSTGAAATVAVGTVSTGAAGTSATVTNAGTSNAAVLNFTIPQGVAGSTGATGTAGPNQVTTSTTTNITGILKGNGTDVAQAVAGTDYDAAGAATTAQTNAETYSANANNLTSGTVAAARMPALTGDCTTTAGAVATTCTKTNGTAFGTMATQNVPTFSTLTDGSTVTWAITSSALANSTLTLVHTTATRSINLTGLVNGGSYLIVLKQDTTGGAAATLGTGCTWYQGGSSGFTASTTLALTTTASAINILAFVYDGTNCYANLR